MCKASKLPRKRTLQSSLRTSRDVRESVLREHCWSSSGIVSHTVSLSCRDHRHRIEHAQHLSPEAPDLFLKYRIVASMQVDSRLLYLWHRCIRSALYFLGRRFISWVVALVLG